MTARERMICALSGGVPDRVPAAPDFSVMLPCKKSGKSFTDVLLRNNPPLWKAYIEALKYYKTDGWFTYGGLQYIQKSECTSSYYEETDDQGRLKTTAVIDTPAGQLTTSTLFFEDDCQVPYEKMIKKFKEDLPKLKYLFPEVTGYDDSLFKEQKKELGELGIMAMDVYPPGMHIFNDFFEGGLEAVTYAYYDEPELFLELSEMYARNVLKKTEMIIDARPDSVLTGGSGSITMQSPDIWDELSFPTLKKIIDSVSEAGIITGVHSCGKERHLIDRLATETKINYVNPLELPPAGDCEIGEIKGLYGDKIALMGNLHTTNTMLNGSRERVRLDSLRAIRDGGIGGGFVLSTGDQTPRDTPDENVTEMLRTVE